jgi:NAD(P)H-dependent FMN reductase
LHERRALDWVEFVPTLLNVHHTPSPFMQAMLEAVVSGANHEDIEDVDVVVRPALSATAVDVLEADGYLLGTPANLGYMSGALKHFFDQVYYPVLEATQKRPYAVYVHGNEGVEGALRAIDAIATGLKWQQVAEPLTVLGQPEKSDLEGCWELGATVAAGLM